MTLVELLVGMVLASIVSAAVVSVLTSQQRFYARAAQTLDGRSQVRQALALLPMELAAVTPSEGEISAVADSVIEFRATIGAGVACSVTDAGGGRVIDVAPARNDSLALAGWSGPPQIGDTLMILNDSTGVFRHVGVTAVDSGATVCAAGPFSAGVAGATRYRITVAEALTTAMSAGVPIRVTRAMRYSLYQSPTDGKWYLGRRVQQAGAGVTMGAVQMVSGPYAPPAVNGSGGLMVRTWQANGTAVPSASPALTARIDLSVRGDSARLSTGSRATEIDSVSVGLRNRY